LRGTETNDSQTYANSAWSASTISGEKLRLKIINDPATPGHLLSSHIGTQGKFEFTHGYAEARMRFHPYHGSHAAFWLQSPNPYSVGRPEIDVVEYFGAHNPDRKSGVNVFHQVYFRDDNSGPVRNMRLVTNDVLDFNTRWYKEFHNFGVKWTSDDYEFYIDGRMVGHINTGVPDDSPKYLVFSNLVRDYEYPDIADHPLDSYKTAVEYVRVWV
jgi:beta-glucanase (GH16 family)